MAATSDTAEGAGALIHRWVNEVCLAQSTSAGDLALTRPRPRRSGTPRSSANLLTVAQHLAYGVRGGRRRGDCSVH